jgi:hypothetical protein
MLHYVLHMLLVMDLSHKKCSGFIHKYTLEKHKVDNHVEEGDLEEERQNKKKGRNISVVWPHPHARVGGTLGS